MTSFTVALLQMAPVGQDTEANRAKGSEFCRQAAAMGEGYSGVAIIAPFGCLPGRLIEGVYSPWAKARNYPVLALENDGQPYPPNIVSRIEVFAHNVLRFEPTPHVDRTPRWWRRARSAGYGLLARS